jgi:hypothetical protein
MKLDGPDAHALRLLRGLYPRHGKKKTNLALYDGPLGADSLDSQDFALADVSISA